jgi:RIO kinase 1
MSIEETDFPVTTYTPTDHEREYLRDSIGEYFADEWLTDILFKVKGGKEATVYCCRATASSGGGLVAAKIYRPRMFRAMRNDWFYRIGRTSLGPNGKMEFRGRAQRALRKHTDFGKKIENSSWNQHEFHMLKTLDESGADIPKPLAHGNNCIMMQYLGDDVRGAPTLHSLRLERDLAQRLFARVLWNVEVLLSHTYVHGDLSAHNILFHDDRAWLIDFPQAVSIDSHPAAYQLLFRDVERVCQYFQKQGVESDPGKVTQDLWNRFLRGEFPTPSP